MIMSIPSTIGSINLLPEVEKRSIYAGVVPPELLDKFQIPKHMTAPSGEDLLVLDCEPGSSDVELALFHTREAADPVLFGHLTDNLQGQLHILLYGMNDPTGERYSVDRLPDGQKTDFGTGRRNISEEVRALKAGLAPGQIYRGPHLFQESLHQFENFAASMGQRLFFAEPLYYHVALIFEKYGFSYRSGKRLMEQIEEGFSEGGKLRSKLDGSTPFRNPQAADRIRLRSWAIHDNILNQPFTNVTMYKPVPSPPSEPEELPLPW